MTFCMVMDDPLNPQAQITEMTMKAGRTHRSTGGPWPRLQSAVLGGRSGVVCRGSRVPRDSLSVGSRCGQTSPTACVSVCEQQNNTITCLIQ